MKIAVVALALAGCFCFASCSQYVDRDETVFFGTGDAVQTNMMAHVIDPWPPGVGNTRISYNGERMQKAAERYRVNSVTDPGCAKPAPNEDGPSPAMSGGTPCSQPANSTERPSAAPAPH